MTSVPVDDRDIDLLSPAAIADPYAVYAYLRQHDPVHWSSRHRAWFLTRHEDVSAAFRDERFSADRISGFKKDKLSGPDADPAVVATFDVLSDWMVFQDGASHLRLRQLVRKAFTPGAAEKLRDAIVAQVESLLDDVVPQGSADLVASFAYPLTATVVGDLLGVPRADLDRFKAWSDQLNTLVSGNQSDANRYRAASLGMAEFTNYLGALLQRYAREPADNLLSAMAAAREGDDALTHEEVVATAVLILFAGHETTTNLLGNFVLALLQHPEAREAVLSGAVDMGRAVEEIMRYDGPARADIRVLATDVELRGKTLRAGQRVVLCIGAANRDPAAFDRPDELVFDRERNAHLGFGFGAHYCLGAPLARLEASEAIPRIFRRLPNLRLIDEEPQWMTGLLNRGLERLPVTWDAR
ncbi:cytochrome P450 [Mycolicibacterium thermoresistibile]